MRAIIISMILLAGAISAPAHAAPTCLLEVEGQRYLDGSCESHSDESRLAIRNPGGGQPHLSASTISTPTAASRCGMGLWEMGGQESLLDGSSETAWTVGATPGSAFVRGDR